MLHESYDLERARVAASRMNDEVPGEMMHLGDNRCAAICCSAFTDSTLGLIKAFPQMVNYATWAAYQFIEYYSQAASNEA